MKDITEKYIEHLEIEIDEKNETILAMNDQIKSLNIQSDKMKYYIARQIVKTPVSFCLGYDVEIDIHDRREIYKSIHSYALSSDIPIDFDISAELLIDAFIDDYQKRVKENGYVKKRKAEGKIKKQLDKRA